MRRRVQAALLTASSSAVVSDPTTILPPWLYLGGARQALDLERLRKLGITHVLNVAGEVACFHADAGIVYEDLGKAVRDVPTYPICKHFGKAIAFIEDARSCGGRVLVHCAAGVSRSPTMVIAYLIETLGWSLSSSYIHCKSLRRAVAPNLGFIQQLVRFSQSRFVPRPCCASERVDLGSLLALIEFVMRENRVSLDSILDLREAFLNIPAERRGRPQLTDVVLRAASERNIQFRIALGEILLDLNLQSVLEDDDVLEVFISALKAIELVPESKRTNMYDICNVIAGVDRVVPHRRGRPSAFLLESLQRELQCTFYTSSSPTDGSV
ncbi:hypothetical protein PBRA_002191 [Plasmodiophora brassicae]|uniref:protein-tyrosine-phosphatase n=1 Tax=Plasmodiophora brassicae TaxID=37360 RepID=A0A0G4J3S0_PLABS|nr:hypothetical protein PBRA_002191 [Plasmodiophora brassicae]